MFRKEVRNLQGFFELLRTVAERFLTEPEFVRVREATTDDSWRTHEVRSDLERKPVHATDAR